jgi:hypothetical protein
MITYRSVLLTMAAGLTALSLTACSAGITSATSAPASGAGGSTVSLGGPLGSFPIPPGAGVLDKTVLSNGYAITLDNVTVATVASFYATALPAAGYTITQHASTTGDELTGTGIEFTGHGYKGAIGAITSPGIGSTPSFPSFSNFPSFPSVTSAAVSGDAVAIALVRQ